MDTTIKPAIAAFLTLTGILIGAAFIALSPRFLGANEAIAQCEAELPRNQQCVITAVPQESE